MIMTLLISLFCHAGDKTFVGEITADKLHQTFSEFEHEFSSYQVSHEDIELIKSVSSPIHLTALFGTWCHDSVREIPRLTKLLVHASNNNITSTLIAVDRQKNTDDTYRLRYTPTIIVYQNNQEIGRIVESPKQSIAKDIVNMLAASVTH